MKGSHIIKQGCHPDVIPNFWEEIILPDTLQMANSDILFDDDGTVTWDVIPNFSCSFITSDYRLIYGAMGGIYVSVDSGYTCVQELVTANVGKDLLLLY